MPSIGDEMRELPNDLFSDPAIFKEDVEKIRGQLDRRAIFGVVYAVPAGLAGAAIGAIGFATAPIVGIVTLVAGAIATTYGSWELTRFLQLRVLQRAHKKLRAIPALDGVGGAGGASVAIPTTDVRR